MRGYQNRGFFAFSEDDGFAFIENQKKRLLAEIHKQSEDYILNVNKVEYIAHLISIFTIPPLELHTDQLSVSTEEKLIPAEMYPPLYHVQQGKAYPQDVFIFHLPFTGQAELLKIRPSTFGMSSPRIILEGQCLLFEVISFQRDGSAIKKEADSIIAKLVSQNAYLTKDLNSFNASIAKMVSQAFDERKAHLLKKNGLLASLGVPIHKSPSTPSTFSIPAKRTPIIQARPKPNVSEKGYRPEPTLDDSIYQQILKITYDLGRQFERQPSTYIGKEEEHLRDHFLLFLEPNFQGSATGETFNKSGKTDILLRHEGSNVFVAELKYWKGKKGYLETISQLLSYLTWRDSKAAVIIFVSNKDITAVLATIEQATHEHSNFLGFVSHREIGWYEYRFHINGDSNREVKLTVQVFHLPP